MSIRIGQWKKVIVNKTDVVYQCSECGNVDNPEKRQCSCCKAIMLLHKEEANNVIYK